MALPSSTAATIVEKLSSARTICGGGEGGEGGEREREREREREGGREIEINH